MPLIVLVGVFWFLIMRPQQRRAREHKMLTTNLSQGDKVVAAGGIVGTVRRVDDDTISLQVADNVVIKVDKGSVSKRLQVRTSAKLIPSAGGPGGAAPPVQ